MPERNYQFRQRLDQVHRPDRRDAALRPEGEEVVLEDGWSIVVPDHASSYVVRVAQDLQDYLLTSMRVSALLVRDTDLTTTARTGTRCIVLGTREQLPEAGDALGVPRSYRLCCCPDRVVVCGCDERGIGQGCYFLEDLMNLREAPYLAPCDETREPVFSPRMVHSGWGIDLFPDAHLNAIAHTGMDAVLVFVKGVDRTTVGYLDINDLIARAAGFGLDVYLYSYLLSEKHPGDPDAEAFYEGTYGELMKAHSGAKGIVFVGESCEFPSRDSHTTQKLRSQRLPTDTKPNPGWWPCVDYPEWLDLVKRVVRRHNPAADVVFWTYNWGWAPEADRLALVRALPGDVSLEVTFEMFENVERRGVPTRCVDYTASFVGPGRYFSSEAAAAHEQGLRLYAMSNTAGLTWDFGVVPYEPIPFQWARRHEALLKAHRDWGLCGLMESHHFAWWPSVASELAKWAYWLPHMPAERIVRRIAHRDFGPEGAPLAVQAWRDWSEAILDYVPTNEDQYGPFRVGPAYPLLFAQDTIEFPCADYAHFGNRILNTNYRPHDPSILDGEIACLEALAERWAQGVTAMDRAVAAAPERKRTECRRTHGLGAFILCCVRTAINVKRWWQLRQELSTAPDGAAAEAVLERLSALAEAEIANARSAIPLVELDSRLGWEPSMEYMADAAHLRWKVEQVRHVIEVEIPACRDAQGAGA